MDESWARLGHGQGHGQGQVSDWEDVQPELHREQHPEPHDTSLSFLQSGVIPDGNSFDFWSATQDFAVDPSLPNDHFLNAEIGIRPFFDGPTGLASSSSGEVYDFCPPSDQFIDDRSQPGDGEPQQQFSTVALGSAGGFGTHLLAAHAGTASNAAYMVEEMDFGYGEPTHRAANPELGWDVDSNPPISWMDFQNVEATLGFDQTSGVEAAVSTEQRSTEDVPSRSSGSNVGSGMTQYQYQTRPIPTTKTTAQPKHGCFMPGCKFTSMTGFEIGRHIRSAHPELLTCRQCQRGFSTLYDLGCHASNTGHAPLACPMEDCEKAFSRYDVLRRHLGAHRSNIQRFPCPHCRRHRGADGFKRKDHLTQHLRNYHHIGVDDLDKRQARKQSCPHEDCPGWRRTNSWGKIAYGEKHVFNKSSDYIAHMRKVHKESEFPCTEPGCDRAGPKGYFRERDLLKHKLKAHGIPIE